VGKTQNQAHMELWGHAWLFDQDGLPWSSRLRWGLLFLWVPVIFFPLTPLVGIYLGVWLISKGKSALVLMLYSAFTIVSVWAFVLPFPTQATVAVSPIEIALEGSSTILWIISAFTLRHQVMDYYSKREGVTFYLNPLLSGIFGPWYVSGRLRADFPVDGTGKAGEGVLKIVL
jgi:hypothetical protein